MPQEKSLVLFQAGPVQPFIAAARSTRDLWSGSYMLSWLMAAAANMGGKENPNRPAASGMPITL